MVKSLKKQFSNLKKVPHPKSRKTAQIAKKLNRYVKLEKSKQLKDKKTQQIGEMLLWFKEQIPKERNTCSPDEAMELITKYIHRFDPELKQLQQKISSTSRSNQHSSRLEAITMTLERETNEFEGGGLEVFDLLNTGQLKLLQEWEGEVNLLPNFKLQRYSKRALEQKLAKLKKTTSSMDISMVEENNSKEIEAE